MVTKHERLLERAQLAKRIQGHADALHKLAILVPFWRVDDTGDEIVMRDMDGNLLITFHGIHATAMAKWIGLLGRLPGMAVADLIREGSASGGDLASPGAAYRLLQEMRLEPKPTRYRR